MMDDQQLIEEFLAKIDELRQMAMIPNVFSVTAQAKIISLLEQLSATVRTPVSNISPTDISNFLDTIMTNALKAIDWSLYEHMTEESDCPISDRDLCLGILSDIYYPVEDEYNFRKLIPDFGAFIEIFLPMVEAYVKMNKSGMKDIGGEG